MCSTFCKNMNRKKILAVIGLTHMSNILVHVLKKKRWRRWWVKKINQRRVQQGVYNNLFRELYFTDEEQFFEYTRMNIRQFDYLFSLIGPLLQKKSMREPLSPRLRLIVTLSYLASGDSLKYLSKYYRIGASTIYKIIPETCESIWQALSPLFLKAPTVKKWSEIAEHFYNRWNLPNCVGALDGKHIRVQCPPHSGSEYFNYKKYFSLVLMACCDANYCFTWVEVGDYGSLPDSSIFENSGLGTALETKSLNLPSPKELPGTNDKIPHFFVGDEAFSLRPDLMRPYSKKGIKSDTERIFNYRLSRARRIIENAFGILSSRWRVLHTCIRMKVENVEKIVLATICLHNFMMMREDREVERRMYCPTTYIDNESNSDGIVTPGTWRDAPACSNLCDFGRLGSNNATRMAMTQRTTLAEWMLTDEGQVPWQFQMILRGYNVHFSPYD